MESTKISQATNTTWFTHPTYTFILCGTRIYREHKTVLINIVFINASLQLFHQLYDKTCIYFYMYIMYYMLM